MFSKLLLIAYKFPPYAGVGGFRWAQMCKYLVRLGVELHVVTVDWRHTTDATLIDAVLDPHIHIYRIPSGYPHNLAIRNFGNRLLNGIRNKIFLYLINKLYPLDIAQDWDKYLLPFCKELIVKYNITTVIATGHPYMANVHAAKLKKELPQIILIQDIRDLWYNEKRIEYPQKLRERIRQLEKFALQTADVVVTVSEGCKRLLQENTGTTPVYVIRNGYDPEKFIASDHSVIHEGTYTFVYLGNLSSGSEFGADAFCEFLRSYPQGRAIFAGSVPDWLLEKYADLQDTGRFIFLGAVSQQKCIDLLRMANFALHFNSKNGSYAPGTKIYEYAASGCPVLSLNFGGEPEYLIRTYHLGLSINMAADDFTPAHIGMILSQFDFGNFSPYDIKVFSYPELAKKYLKLIRNI